METVGTALDCIDENNIVLGTNDGSLFHYDFRENRDKKLCPHNREVCKVKYEPYLNYIISGGNDNNVNIFDLRAWKLVKQINHLAAVKAIDVDNSKMLTGAGLADKTLRLWNLKSSSDILLESEIKIDSQISNVHFLSNNLVISSQGYIANNLKLFKIDENSKLLELPYNFVEHKKRVLYTALKQNKEKILSQSSDGECKLWNLDYFYNLGKVKSDLFDYSLR